MLKKIQRFSFATLTVLTVFCIIMQVAVLAANVNMGVRHTVCTSLSEQAKDYYKENNVHFDTTSKLKGGSNNCLTTLDSALFDELHDLMDETMTGSISYSSLEDYWYTTDANNGSSKPRLFYSDIDSSGFNREHVWPKSRASFKKLNGGCDPHHLRPTNSSMNSTRSNYCMGNVRGVLSGYKTKTNGNGSIYYLSSADRVEVDDKIKGDVARILLYVYCRWEEPNLFMDTPNPVVGPGDDANNGKKVMESLETLLQWCKMDPVDTWEMERNDQCENIVGNRNVFIDYPEYAWLLFGESVPTDMVTPSGKAKSGADNDNNNNNTSNNSGTNTDNNLSVNTSTNTSVNTSISTSTNTSTDDTNNTTSNNSSAVSEEAQGGIDNKPQNEGKPYDPNNIGSQYIETEGAFVLENWAIIAIVVVVILCATVVTTVIIVEKRKIK